MTGVCDKTTDISLQAISHSISLVFVNSVNFFSRLFSIQATTKSSPPCRSIGRLTVDQRNATISIAFVQQQYRIRAAAATGQHVRLLQRIECQAIRVFAQPKSQRRQNTGRAVALLAARQHQQIGAEQQLGESDQQYK